MDGFVAFQLASILSITAGVFTLFAVSFLLIPSNKGAVVANGPGCAQVGGSVLKEGGTAVDAAIAVLLCDGIMLPQSMGIGGGFVATIYKRSDKKIDTLIARETAPAGANETMFANVTKEQGVLFTGIPGELLGYWEMHEKYGQLPWKRLFRPAVKLCKNGFKVNEFLERSLREDEDIIRAEPTLAEIFVKEDGELYKAGDYIRRPRLARTLEMIGDIGIHELYGRGTIAKLLIKDIQDRGGIMTLDDLTNYKVQWDSQNYTKAALPEGNILYSTPLPTSGPLLGFMMNIISGLYTDNLPVYYQRLVETFKHAYGHRSSLGDFRRDPEMAPIIKKSLNNLNNQTELKRVRSLIYDTKTFQDFEYYGANFDVRSDFGTANIAVLAENGDAITVTSTINTNFGCKVRSRHTGIILNDEMDDFSRPNTENYYGIPPSQENFIKPGKRPMSSMCPSIVLDQNGSVRMLVGAAGGTKITTAVAMAMVKHLILKQSLEEAIDGGRLHHQLAPMRLDIEPEVPQYIQEYLKFVGHKSKILEKESGFAAATAISFGDYKPFALFDRRRGGSKVVL